MAIVGVPYLAFELFIQKSAQRGIFGDALFDTFMVLCGAALLLLPFRETKVVSIFEVHLAFNPVVAVGIWLLRDSAAFRRVWKRR